VGVRTIGRNKKLKMLLGKGLKVIFNYLGWPNPLGKECVG